ncbi:MAG: NAD/NADP octopine/nopaline dehydrogenase family protein [Candidatus Atribacteria bacterium]|nr:NAD/NADP octopine/nopaline dehydrogenase family protein [Candidatus Atribacteria bacterium]
MGIKTITICGSGNASHAMIPVIKSNFNGKINLFFRYQHKVDIFQKLIGEKRFIIAQKGQEKLYGRPDKVSRYPEEVCQDADLILLPLPAFAHDSVLLQIAPFLKEKAIIGTVPARGGFEYSALKILKMVPDKKLKFFGLQTLPWACRTREYASKVEILGEKEVVGLAAYPHEATSELSDIITNLLNIKMEPLPNMLTLTLANIGQIVHPGIMYGLFKGKENRKYKKEEIPLFYQGVTGEIAQTLTEMSDEILTLTEVLQKKFKNLDLTKVLSLREWLLTSYKNSIGDDSTLENCFVTNRAYQGLRAPMREVENGYLLPDFQSRYLTEDVPYGLIVTRAIAQLAGVNTPTIDEVISTTSKWMEKDYLVNGYLKGRDILETRIPQNYGFNQLEEIVNL